MGDIHVCHLLHDLALGGLENQVLRIIRATDDPSIAYTVCYVGDDDSMTGEFRDAGARVVHLDTGSTDPIAQFRPRSLRRLKDFLRREQVDVLHCHGSLYQHVVGRICGQFADCTVVSTYHNRQDSFHPATRVLERLTRPLGDVNIAVSKGVEISFTGSAQVYDPDQPVLDRRSYTVYNGIDVEQFASGVDDADPGGLGQDGSLEDDLVFLNIGRYAPEKNQRVLLEAMARVVDDVPDAHLYVVGWGELESELQSDAARYGIEDAVTVTGRVPSVTEYYALADVFVLPSLSEGLSVVLLEAMAAGLPIVASSIPGTTEAVVDGETGYLVGPNSASDLARAMVRMNDADRRRRFGAAGHELVTKRFDIRTTVGSYLDVYRRVA